MPKPTNEERALEIIGDMEALGLSLEGDKGNSRFWVSFELFNQPGRRGEHTPTRKLRDTSVHALLHKIAQLKFDLGTERGQHSPEAESQLIADVAQRDQFILELQQELFEAVENVNFLSTEIDTIRGEINNG